MLTGTAPCGMRYAVHKAGSAVAYCALSIKVGTRDEDGFHSGIAHFTEHTIFKGTKKKSASVINGYLDRLGGELNAYTTKEEIVLHATVLKEDFRKAGSLLLELASSSVFPEKEIETERGVVIDEIQSYKDSPADHVYDRFEEKIFEGHPLSKPILGTVSSVKKITSEELRRFVSEKFIPGLMALTVVAPLEEKLLEKDVLKMISKFFGETPSEIPVRPLSTPLFRKFDIRTDKRNHEVNAVIGGLAPSLYEEKDRYAAILMSNILGGPASNSILNSVLREKNGWVYAVETSYTQYSDSGLLAVCLGCDKSNLDKCLAAVKKEIVRLQTIPLSPSKLSAAKKQLLGQLSISGDNGESQCLSMGKNLLSFGRISPNGEIRSKIGEISSQDILDVARRIFDPSRTSTLIFL
ncbi:MAG: insulinase family protein [Bacteroidales bacterium]|nr:insulinase family protein [Bacteroidales bacterium]